MFFTSRNRINRSRKQGASNSKSSDKSVTHNICKKKPKVPQITKAQLQLRIAIQNKYAKSKIKNFRYQHPNQVSQIRSQKSIQMDQYSWLKSNRYINLKEYHTNLSKSETIQKKYLIRIKHSQNRKTIKTQSDIEFSPQNNFIKDKPNKLRNLIDSFGFQERRTCSDEKKTRQWRQLGFDWKSTSKKVRNNYVSPSDQKEQTFYFRKTDKYSQPYRQIRSQNDK